MLSKIRAAPVVTFGLVNVAVFVIWSIESPAVMVAAT
jgi:hypothetical protein